MDDILALSIDPLMLKKHPHIVETVKRVNDIQDILIIYYVLYHIEEISFERDSTTSYLLFQLRRYIGNLGEWKLSEEEGVYIYI